jgi:hypothetical protein
MKIYKGRIGRFLLKTAVIISIAVSIQTIGYILLSIIISIVTGENGFLFMFLSVVFIPTVSVILFCLCLFFAILIYKLETT